MAIGDTPYLTTDIYIFLDVVVKTKFQLLSLAMCLFNVVSGSNGNILGITMTGNISVARTSGNRISFGLHDSSNSLNSAKVISRKLLIKPPQDPQGEHVAEHLKWNPDQ